MTHSFLGQYQFSNEPEWIFRRNLELKGRDSIDSLGGDDVILGKSRTDNGIIVKGGAIQTSSGDDFVIGRSTVDSGRGSNDRGHGIHNVGGVIHTGSGNDSVIGFNSSRGRAGILSSGLIATGHGDDLVNGVGTFSSGIRVDSGGNLKTGHGNDTIRGVALNSLLGSAISVQGGKIAMHAGNDLLDAAQGGISGQGTIRLGKGDDTFSGFVKEGNVRIDGGKGNDLVSLVDESYVVAIDNGVVSFINGSRILETFGFERVELGGRTFSIDSLLDDQILGI